LQLLKPTLIPCVPRLFKKIHDKVYLDIESNVIKKWLLQIAIKLKSKQINQHIVHCDGLWDRLVFNKIRLTMGGNVRLIIVGAAPLSPDLLNFMRCALGCIVRR